MPPVPALRAVPTPSAEPAEGKTFVLQLLEAEVAGDRAKVTELVAVREAVEPICDRLEAAAIRLGDEADRAMFMEEE